MKRTIDLWQYAGHILQATGKGVLLTTADRDQVNTMTIGWGTLGIQWGKPIFIAFVRESRHTKALLDKTGEFTVNVPLDTVDKNILGVCGSRSGRDVDKFALLGLTPEPGETVSVPGIRQLPLTLECKIIYRQAQEPQAIAGENMEKYYSGISHGDAGDYHTAYYGQVTAAYIIE